MDVFLELQTTEPEELREAVTGALPTSTHIKLADDLRLRFAGLESQRADTALVIFALTFPVGIATNVIADLISQFLKDRKARDKVERAFITFEEEVERVDSNGNRTTKKTTRRIDIPIN
jgi:hypothetical protein